MYENLLQCNKNIITVNCGKFREIIQYTENQDKIIKYFIKINKKLVKEYGSFSYIFSVKTSLLSDIQYLNFFIKFTLTMQDNFPDELDSIIIEDTNDIVIYLFSYVSVFFTPDVSNKIHFV